MALVNCFKCWCCCSCKVNWLKYQFWWVVRGEGERAYNFLPCLRWGIVGWVWPFNNLYANFLFILWMNFRTLALFSLARVVLGNLCKRGEKCFYLRSYLLDRVLIDVCLYMNAEFEILCAVTDNLYISLLLKMLEDLYCDASAS